MQVLPPHATTDAFVIVPSSRMPEAEPAFPKMSSVPPLAQFQPPVLAPIVND
jgi:hypothetical protein